MPWALELSGGYLVAAHSPQIPFVHGPYLRAGVEYRQSRHHLGIGALGNYLLPDSYEAEGVTLGFRSLSLRGELRFLFFDLDQKWGVGPFVGGGAEVTWLNPSTEQDTWKTGGRSQQTTGFIVPGLTVQIRLNRWVRFELNAELDIDFQQVEYALEEGGESRPLVSKMPLRPAFRAGVSFF
jgi:hypothetical protein